MVRVWVWFRFWVRVQVWVRHRLKVGRVMNSVFGLGFRVRVRILGMS